MNNQDIKMHRHAKFLHIQFSRIYIYQRLWLDSRFCYISHMEVGNVPLIPLYLSRVTARGLYAHEWDGDITK